MKLTKPLLLISGSLISVVAVSLTVALLPSAHSPDGLPGHWTAEQKANAEFVMQSQPVAESAGLAACVTLAVSSQVSYADFQAYATLAKADDFSNPDSTQSSVISTLMVDALTCPEGS